MNAALGTIARSQYGARAQLAVPLSRLAAARNPAQRPLQRALATTLAGRLTGPERDWVERIEARRGELATHGEATPGPFDPGTRGREGLFSGGSETTVGGAASMMSLSRPWCTLLLRIVRELRPASCLELGSGFGISGAYLAAALRLNAAGALTTMEGSESIAAHARATFDSLGLEETRLTVGPIGETLPAEVERARPIDFAFIDAEHQAAATLEHFRALLPGLAPGAVLVFDDVRWDEMAPAFAQIGGHERVAATLGMGRLGLARIR